MIYFVSSGMIINLNQSSDVVKLVERDPPSATYATAEKGHQQAATGPVTCTRVLQNQNYTIVYTNMAAMGQFDVIK